ncbi:MAG: DUF2851 family protein [Cyclobacteriaceae bacterium]|nr:DUF2851 family protein [Cyclobacteriaceae bacterium]
MIQRYIPTEEDFVHFVWMNQYFNKEKLEHTHGESVQIIHPGYRNIDSGPDFNESRIKINNIEWRGQVEIHIKSSDWYQHNHHFDKSYDSVILHVVWIHDRTVKRTDGSEIPTIELENRVNPKLINNFKGLNNLLTIPCENQLHEISAVIKQSMIEYAAVERIEKKMNDVSKLMISTLNNWDIIALRLLLSTLGFNKNSQPFQILGRTIPWNKWPTLSLFQKEALLFGQAGFLNKVIDPYSERLKKEYLFLKYKWNLNSPLELHQWKFMRMRPAQFPTVRIAQFCAITNKEPSLFKTIIHSTNLMELYKKFKTNASDYWIHHYHFFKFSPSTVGKIGKQSLEKIVINFVVPLLFGYSNYIDDDKYKIQAIGLLENLSAEHNKITKQWKSLGMAAKNGFDSQGLLQLYNHYCNNHFCLNCKIGKNLIINQLN